MKVLPVLLLVAGSFQFAFIILHSKHTFAALNVLRLFPDQLGAPGILVDLIQHEVVFVRAHKLLPHRSTALFLDFDITIFVFFEILVLRYNHSFESSLLRDGVLVGLSFFRGLPAHEAEVGINSPNGIIHLGQLIILRMQIVEHFIHFLESVI